MSYICDKEITDTKCYSHSIYRDTDYITVTPSDVIYSMSLNLLIRNKTRGRKRDRWLSYLYRYRLTLDPSEFSAIIKTGALLTIYVDGIDVDEKSGDVVIKNFRITGSGSYENLLNKLLEANPRLVTINKKDYWFLIDAYKIDYLDLNLKKTVEEFIGYKRMECKEIKTIKELRICFT